MMLPEAMGLTAGSERADAGNDENEDEGSRREDEDEDEEHMSTFSDLDDSSVDDDEVKVKDGNDDVGANVGMEEKSAIVTSASDLITTFAEASGNDDDDDDDEDSCDEGDDEDGRGNEREGDEEEEDEVKAVFISAAATAGK
jgi:hypothetical protein